VAKTAGLTASLEQSRHPKLD